jgi:hypothetical protein
MATIVAMTAPGNSALIFTLMAVFVACCGYAAGRLHQRYQMERDREEAYRDGYDSATRSIFSLAARVIAPRRGVRASAPVVLPAEVPAQQPVVDGAVVADSTSPGPVGPAAALLRRSAVPGAAPASAPPAPTTPSLGIPVPPPAPTTPSLGFPVPPPPSSRIVEEPPAVGGVVYQPFPDPRSPEEVALPVAPDVSSGRHTVPDELVQGSTYRLPADRVFRAKVPESGPGLPDESTTRLSVPRPRHS